MSKNLQTKKEKALTKQQQVIFDKLLGFKKAQVLKLEAQGLSKASIIQIYVGRYPWLKSV